jgi:hypothetical protein
MLPTLARVHTPVVLCPVLHCIVTDRTISLIEVGLVAGAAIYYVGARRLMPGEQRTLPSLGVGAFAAFFYHSYAPEEIA